MAFTANLVKQSTTGTGTGNLTVASVVGFRTFSSAFGTGSSAKFLYCIRHVGTLEWEVGWGYMSDATTLVRDTILESSNANAAVNFSAGTKDVICDVPASLQEFLAKVFVQSSAPSAPNVGDLWIDLSAALAVSGRILNVQGFPSSTTYNRTAGVGKAIVILAGATGGGSANSTNNGGAGTTTSFGSHVSCTGGAGGTLKTVDNTFIPATAGSPTGHNAIIGDRSGGAGASGYDGGGQWRHGQPGGHAPVVLAYITPGATETVTIGAAGAGGAAGAEAGENGFAGYILVIELE